MTITAATLFSGIGAPEVAMPHWDWAWHAEIEKFPSAVMAARHPGSINLGDVTAHDFTKRAEAIARPDVVVFGSPCQSFSIAGKRLGLDDPRGNLALVALGIVARLKPRWFVFENVPGLMSSDGGRDFGAFIGLVDELRYSLCWARLDAQHFGVAQRRERVFAVGHLGDWRYPAAVLLEPEGLCGDHPPRREAGQRPADPITSSFAKHGGASAGKDSTLRNFAFNNTGQGWWNEDKVAAGMRDASAGGASHSTVVSHALNAHGGGGRSDGESETFVTHALRADGFDASEDGTGRGTPLVTHALDSFSAGRMTEDGTGRGCPIIADTVRSHPRPGSNVQGGVRRLMPSECESLQGFPQNYTLISFRKKPAADGPRYKALGNSMAVPVIRWILNRIEIFETQVLPAVELDHSRSAESPPSKLGYP